MIANWLLTPGLYIVGENEDGDELVLSGPWFTPEEADCELQSWHNPDQDISIVGWLREEDTCTRSASA